MIRRYTPMAPALVRESFHRAGWIYEEKVDGWRIVAYKDRDCQRQPLKVRRRGLESQANVTVKERERSQRPPIRSLAA